MRSPVGAEAPRQISPGSESQVERPLVSLVVFAYRQEAFIRDAIEGAFGQDYQPLEILLSDDASPDDTYAIMDRMAAEYRGPHAIQLNRNPSNLGLAGHLNRCMELARGEWVVIAAGDDISLPTRVSRVVDAWRDSGCQARSVYSDARGIDFHGDENGVIIRRPSARHQNDILRLCREGKVGVTGCAHAWHRSVFDHFGPLRTDVRFEDGVIPLRSRLLGSVVHIPESLVLYRMWDGSMSQPNQPIASVAEYKRKRAANAEQLIAVHHQWEADFAKVDDPPPGYQSMVAAMVAKARFIAAMQRPGFGARFRAFREAAGHPSNWRYLASWYPRCAFSLVYDAWIRRRIGHRSGVC